MLTFIGKPVGKNYGMGKVICLRNTTSVKQREISSQETTKEHLRFDNVINEVIIDIDQTLRALDLDKEQIDILNTHKMILQDPEMLENIRDMISEELVSLEHALQKNLISIKELFSSMNDDYLAARYLDYKDVTQRLMNKLGNNAENTDNWTDSIILADEITPSQVLEAYRKHAGGLISISGSTKSHTAILAKSLMIPFITELSGNTDYLCRSTFAIMDCIEGKVIIDPEDSVTKQYEQKLRDYQDYQKELSALVDKEVVTADGRRVKLMCNIEIPEEIEIIKKLNSDGVGLFRTEFLYLEGDKPPTEDEQYEIYKKAAQKLAPLPLVIRTMDVGGDKIASYLQQDEDNPNLGLRGIRMSFSKPDIFKAQLRAILRASAYGNIHIMFPMISSVEEIKKAKQLINKYAEDLKKENKKHNADLPIGTMIEVPSAALMADQIASECDFLSIGTNDLVQYTLAVDRNNELVSEYYIESNPAVLFLIENVCRAAHANNIEVAVCGEMASQSRFISKLLVAGVDHLSASPDQYSEIKKEILGINLKENER